MENTDIQWIKYELEKSNKTQEKIFEKIDKLSLDINKTNINVAKLSTAFKIKSSVWGLLGGSIPIFITILIYLLRSLI